MPLFSRNKKTEVPWVAMTDLAVGLFALFVFAFIALWSLKDQVTEDFTRKEDEFQKCVNEKRRTQEALMLYNQMLGEKLKVPIQQGLLAVNDGQINIQAALLFSSGQANITDDGGKIIQTVTEALGQMVKSDTSFMLMVAGYTDDVPTTHAELKTNWELSGTRATNVVHALIASGFPKDRVFAAGFGEQHPRSSNTEAEGRAMNRRVEIIRVPISKNHFTWNPS